MESNQMPGQYNQHQRHSIRLAEYDYTLPGAYFVTIVTHQREYIFGKIHETQVHLTPIGETALACWLGIPVHFHNVSLDEFVIMPNHIHGIIIINDVSSVGTRHASSLQKPSQHDKPHGPKPNSLGAIIGNFKSAVSKRINEQRTAPGAPVWQRNYYEHIIRDEKDLNSIRKYILENPMQWVEGDEYIP
jgi:putative transposase